MLNLIFWNQSAVSRPAGYHSESRRHGPFRASRIGWSSQTLSRIRVRLASFPPHASAGPGGESASMFTLQAATEHPLIDDRARARNSGREERDPHSSESLQGGRPGVFEDEGFRSIPVIDGRSQRDRDL